MPNENQIVNLRERIKDVEYRFDVTDSHRGELSCEVGAWLDGKAIGYVQFSELENGDMADWEEKLDEFGSKYWEAQGQIPREVFIKYVFVDPAYRRLGIATGMYQRIQKEFPGEKIVGNGTTEEGGKFRSKLLQRGILSSHKTPPIAAGFDSSLGVISRSGRAKTPGDLRRQIEDIMSPDTKTAAFALAQGQAWVEKFKSVGVNVEIIGSVAKKSQGRDLDLKVLTAMPTDELIEKAKSLQMEFVGNTTIGPEEVKEISEVDDRYFYPGWSNVLHFKTPEGSIELWEIDEVSMEAIRSASHKTTPLADRPSKLYHTIEPYYRFYVQAHGLNPSKYTKKGVYLASNISQDELAYPEKFDQWEVDVTGLTILPDEGFQSKNEEWGTPWYVCRQLISPDRLKLLTTEYEPKVFLDEDGEETYKVSHTNVVENKNASHKTPPMADNEYVEETNGWVNMIEKRKDSLILPAIEDLVPKEASKNLPAKFKRQFNWQPAGSPVRENLSYWMLSDGSTIHGSSAGETHSEIAAIILNSDKWEDEGVCVEFGQKFNAIRLASPSSFQIYVEPTTRQWQALAPLCRDETVYFDVPTSKIDNVMRADSIGELRRKVEAHFHPVKTSKLGPHKNANVQIALPAAAAQKVFEVIESIPEADLGNEGRENDPHITVKFGVEENEEALAEAVRGWPPFTVTLGKVEIFEPSESSKGNAPIVALAQSSELNALHQMVDSAIGNRADDFPYKPHVTLAYLKPEAARKYKGSTLVEGVSFPVKTVVLSSADGSRTVISFEQAMAAKMGSGEEYTSGDLIQKGITKLYHGTSSKFVEEIKAKGLSGNRIYATSDPSTAWDEAGYTIHGDPWKGDGDPAGGTRMTIVIDLTKFDADWYSDPEYDEGRDFPHAFWTDQPVPVQALSFSTTRIFGSTKESKTVTSKTASKDVDPKDLMRAALQAREYMIPGRDARSGDCQPVSEHVVHLLHEMGYEDAFEVWGSYDRAPHVYVRVGDWYVDPTFEQFDPDTDEPIRVGKTSDPKFQKHADLRPQGLGRYSYHATYSALLDSIKEKGLGAVRPTAAWSFSNPGVVYLANSPDVAESYAETAEEVSEEWLNDIVVLKIDNNKLDSSRLSKDPNKDLEGTYQYAGVIPYSAVVKVIKTAKGQTIGQVYLLHFNIPPNEVVPAGREDSGVFHARHYLGWAENAERRIQEHRDGTGARLTEVLKNRGFDFTVARIWNDVDRNFERRLKNQGGLSSHCHICKELGIDRYSLRKKRIQEKRNEVQAAPETATTGPDFLEQIQTVNKKASNDTVMVAGMLLVRVHQCAECDTWDLFDKPMNEGGDKLGEISLYHYPEWSFPSVNFIYLMDEARGKGLGRQTIVALAKFYGGLTSDPQRNTNELAKKMWQAIPGVEEINSPKKFQHAELPENEHAPWETVEPDKMFILKTSAAPETATSGPEFLEQIKTSTLKTWWHVSSVVNRTSILTNGLRIPKIEEQQFYSEHTPGVYVFPSESQAVEWALNHWHSFASSERGLDLWAVDIDPRFLVPDEHPESKGAYYSPNAVPANRLKLESYLTEDGEQHEPSDEDGHLDDDDDIEYVEDKNSTIKISAATDTLDQYVAELQKYDFKLKTTRPDGWQVWVMMIYGLESIVELKQDEKGIHWKRVISGKVKAQGSDFKEFLAAIKLAIGLVHHEQVIVQTKDGPVSCDKLIAPMIRYLNSLPGVSTFSSCQGTKEGEKREDPFHGTRAFVTIICPPELVDHLARFLYVDSPVRVNVSREADNRIWIGWDPNEVQTVRVFGILKQFFGNQKSKGMTAAAQGTVLYHGTSVPNARAIIQNGFNKFNVWWTADLKQAIDYGKMRAKEDKLDEYAVLKINAEKAGFRAIDLLRGQQEGNPVLVSHWPIPKDSIEGFDTYPLEEKTKQVSSLASKADIQPVQNGNKLAFTRKMAFTIEVPKSARDHFWEEPPEGNLEFWAFSHPIIVLPGEKIFFTFDDMPVAEAIALRVESPGMTECEKTHRYKDHHKVFWDPKYFKSYGSKTAAYDSTFAQEVIDLFRAHGVETKVVGSVATKGVSQHDLDLLITQKTPYNTIKLMLHRLESKEFEYDGTSWVFPKEIPKEDKRTFAKGFSLIFHMEIKNHKVELWIPEELMIGSYPDQED